MLIIANTSLKSSDAILYSDSRISKGDHLEFLFMLDDRNQVRKITVTLEVTLTL